MGSLQLYHLKVQDGRESWLVDIHIGAGLGLSDELRISPLLLSSAQTLGPDNLLGTGSLKGGITTQVLEIVRVFEIL